MSIYDRLWTIRGLIDVHHDIMLLPGDQLRVVGNGVTASGAPRHRIIVFKGNSVWESCNDLVEQQGDDATIANLPAVDSVSLSNGGGARHFKIEEFLGDNPHQFRRLTGTITVSSSDVADVTIWVPKCPSTGREAIIIKALPRDNAPHQNGTGHGDWD